MSNIRIIVVNHADRFPLTNSATENLCLQNSAFNESPWMVTGTTVTPNTGMGISGANVADTIADTSGVATQSLSQTITVPNDGQVYTCSIYIQTAGASLPRPSLAWHWATRT